MSKRRRYCLKDAQVFDITMFVVALVAFAIWSAVLVRDRSIKPALAAPTLVQARGT